VTTASPEDLMVAYVGGDSNAFDKLYRLIAPQLNAYLLRLTRDPARTEDLLQVTFTKVYRARYSYIEGAPLLPWVFAIARRCFLDERRSSKSQREALSLDGNIPESPRSLDPPPSNDTESIDHALNRLPESYREAIQLTKIAGLSLVEAATILETTPTAVKLRVHRGYAMLRELLQPPQRKPL
jgi:RNA polymerase sigma-70 factor (ECF subfamily)